jgi:5'-nucleotidase
MRRLVLDVDGVLADFVGHTLTLLGPIAPQGGRNAFTTWDFVTTLEPHVADHCIRGWRQQGWCRSIPPIDGAVEAVKQIRQAGVEVVYATSPMRNAPHWVEERFAWLAHHFDADADHVALVHNKALIPGTVMVDDKPENVEAWARTYPSASTFLWSAPYNASSPLGALNAFRIDGWDRVHQALGLSRAQLKLPGIP